MPIINIHSLNDAGLEPYAKLTDHQLRSRLHPREGTIIVESPKVITTALNAGLEPLSLLCEERHLQGDAEEIVKRLGNKPIYTGDREVLAKLTGYTLTRGVLCAMRRPEDKDIKDICRKASRIVIIDAVCDTTNIGAIFRSAAALGIDGALLTKDSCDPLNRRAIRVSMGTVFQMPWAWTESIDVVHKYQFKTVAMALRNDSISLGDPKLKEEPRLAIIMGTEGDGLPSNAIDDADYVIRIPMHHGVDSLNVAAASAVAFWELRK